MGFVGVGWIGLHRMKAMLQSGAIEASAIVDPSEEALREALSAAPGAQPFRDFEEATLEGLDGIVIATPSALHAEQARAALNAGAAVFCQKPLARSGRETQWVVHAAQKADKLLSVDFSYRFLKGMKQMREAIRKKEIGEVYGVDLTFHNAYGPDKPWYYNPVLAGGGCVMDLGVHLIDLMMWTLDFPDVSLSTSRLYSKGALLTTRDSAVEDYAAAQMDLGSGAVARLTCSWRLSAGCDAEIAAVFYGTRGGLAVRNVNGSFYEFSAERLKGTSRESIEDPSDWWGRSAIVWARRLARSKRYDGKGDELVRVAEVVDAIYGRKERSAFGDQQFSKTRR